jgi:hypothetical protein
VLLMVLADRDESASSSHMNGITMPSNRPLRRLLRHALLPVAALLALAGTLFMIGMPAQVPQAKEEACSILQASIREGGGRAGEGLAGLLTTAHILCAAEDVKPR